MNFKYGVLLVLFYISTHAAQNYEDNDPMEIETTNNNTTHFGLKGKKIECIGYAKKDNSIEYMVHFKNGDLLHITKIDNQLNLKEWLVDEYQNLFLDQDLTIKDITASNTDIICKMGEVEETFSVNDSKPSKHYIHSVFFDDALVRYNSIVFLAQQYAHLGNIQVKRKLEQKKEQEYKRFKIEYPLNAPPPLNTPYFKRKFEDDDEKSDKRKKIS